MSGYLRVLCAVFLLSVPFVNCLTNATLSKANVTTTASVQRPQQSSLDKYLRTQRSFVIVSAAESFDTLQDSSEIQNVTSDNYPSPYPIKKVITRLSVTNATGMNIVINDLDIDPLSDYIALVPLNSNGTEGRSYLATGKLKQPLAIRVLGYTKANLVFESTTSPDHSYRGFSISYSPYGEAPLPSTQPPDVTLAYSQLQTISKLLVITKQNQTESTWSTVKQLFADSTNLYIPSTNLSLESAFSQNVTLVRVAECFNNWPNSEDCVEVEFAITLYNDTSKNPTDDPFLDDRTPREPAGLNALQLEEMWVQFGKSVFERNSITEYELPDTRTRILMWVGIAIGTCVLLFLIFVAVFRSPAFRDRWVEDDTIAIQNKDEDHKQGSVDITIYPSPDQIVPEMYPGSSNGQITPNEFGLEGRIRNFETINEAYTEDDRPSTRM